MNDYWMEWFVGSAKKDSYSEDFAEDSCANTSYNLPASPVDLWAGSTSKGTEGPARGLNGTGTEARTRWKYPYQPVSGCSVGQNNTCQIETDCQPYPGYPGAQIHGCDYEDALFTAFVKNAVLQHDEQRDGGLFVFWAPHVIHTPLEVPEVYLQKFAAIRDWRRRRYVAMVNYLDDSVGAVVDALDARGLLDSTLITFSSDNGVSDNDVCDSSLCLTPLCVTQGPVYGNGTSGANNWPLRGASFVATNL